FHYGTSSFAKDYERLCCSPQNVHPEVLKRGNPVVTLAEPLAIPGYDGNLGLEYNFSIPTLAIDLEPSNRFVLPPELNPPLKPQSVALQGIICGGIACPDPEILDRFIIFTEPYRPNFNPANNKDKKRGNDQQSEKE